MRIGNIGIFGVHLELTGLQSLLLSSIVETWVQMMMLMLKEPEPADSVQRDYRTPG